MSVVGNPDVDSELHRATMIHTFDPNTNSGPLNNVANLKATEDRQITMVHLILEGSADSGDNQIGGAELSFDNEWHDGLPDQQEPDPVASPYQAQRVNTVAELRHIRNHDDTNGVGLGQADYEWFDFTPHAIQWDESETIFLHAQQNNSTSLAVWCHIYYLAASSAAIT